MKYESPEHLATKIEWEGGLYDFVNSYGLSIDELPEGTPDHIIAAFVQIKDAQNAENTIWDWLPNPGEIEEYE